MTTGVFIGIAVLMKRHYISQSVNCSSQHILFLLLLFRLIRYFASRLFYATPRPPSVGAYAREGIRAEPAGPLLPVSRRNDRHLACNRCDHASSGEDLFIDLAVLPASQRCLRSRVRGVRACVSPTLLLLSASSSV